MINVDIVIKFLNLMYPRNLAKLCCKTKHIDFEVKSSCNKTFKKCDLTLLNIYSAFRLDSGIKECLYLFLLHSGTLYALP